MQTKHWCFTINNWTADDDDRLVRLGSQVEYLVYGYETGEQGTPHLQGYIVFPTVKRLAVAKALISDRAHLEPKRGSAKQAADYCIKDGVYKEYGVQPRSPGTGGQFTSFIEWIMSRSDSNEGLPTDREIAQAFPSLFVRYSRKLRELAEHHFPPPDLIGDAILHPWQQMLHDILLEPPPDDRSILFYVDDEGGKGKSFFQRYMISRFPHKVQILSVGKRDDIAHAVDVSKSIFLFNIPRTQMEFVQYSTFEAIKDRMIFSPKYDSTMKTLKQNPHVVIFCNEEPDMEKLTADRYNIIRDYE